MRDERPEAAAQPAPLKQVDIRIPDAQGGVTVRVHERAGAVHVSVRSADAQMAGNIAETLPDLTRQLDHQGFHSETWTPSKESVFQAEQMMRAHDLNSASTNADTAHAHQPADSAHTQNETDDDRRRPDWEEPTPKRPKTPRSDDFKEYL